MTQTARLALANKRHLLLYLIVSPEHKTKDSFEGVVRQGRCIKLMRLSPRESHRLLRYQRVDEGALREVVRVERPLGSLVVQEKTGDGRGSQGLIVS